MENHCGFLKEPAMRKLVRHWKLLAKQLNIAYRNAHSLHSSQSPSQLTSAYHVIYTRWEELWRFGGFFSQMTPTFYFLSPGTGNRALNNDRIAVTQTPTKRYLRCTKNISILVEHLNYLFMAIPCLHQGCISWQVRWLMIQQIVKSFFCKN